MSNRGGKRPGSGRKPIDPDDTTITVAITVPSKLVERLDAEAEQRDMNRSEFLRAAIESILERKAQKLSRR